MKIDIAVPTGIVAGLTKALCRLGLSMLVVSALGCSKEGDDDTNAFDSANASYSGGPGSSGPSSSESGGASSSTGNADMGDPSTTDPSTSNPSTTDPSTSNPSTGGPDGEGTGGIKFDIPSEDGGSVGEGSQGEGCKNVDFLFVVDNSGSMGPHQGRLLASFGPFMDTITSKVQGTDFHVMVIDSDECQSSGCNAAWGACNPVLGSGQVRGCNVPGGIRYLTSALDAATLKSTFQCLANVGTDGNAYEMPMSAMVQAIGPLQAPGACNQGFLRDDAVLVIVLLTDDHEGLGDPDDAKLGDPQVWYDAVISAKGKVENVVVVGLYSLAADPGCNFFPGQASKFVAFTEKFGAQGMVESICAPDFNAVFARAVDLIDTTCDNFDPVE